MKRLLDPFMIRESLPALTETVLSSHPCCIVSISYEMSRPFHGGNTGSNPVGDAKSLNNLHALRFFTRYVTGSQGSIARRTKGL
jgi:hypothetical protein